MPSPLLPEYAAAPNTSAPAPIINLVLLDILRRPFPPIPPPLLLGLVGASARPGKSPPDASGPIGGLLLTETGVPVGPDGSANGLLLGPIVAGILPVPPPPTGTGILFGTAGTPPLYGSSAMPGRGLVETGSLLGLVGLGLILTGVVLEP